MYACNGPLTRYVKLRVAHAPGMPGTTSKVTVSKRSRHASRHVRHARAVMHVGIANPRWRGKRTRHSRRMRNPQFYVSGKRSMERVQNSSFECCNCMVSLNDMLLFVTAMKHQFVSSQKVKTCRTEVKVCSVESESVELSLDKSIVIPEYFLS